MQRNSLPIIDLVPLNVELVGEISDLGLREPEPDFSQCAFVTLLDSKPYIAEARDTFIALVPERYKVKG